MLSSVLKSAVTAAPSLLGWKLIVETASGRIGGYIVETEAYTSDDPASHTFRGPSLRNASMFGPAGTVYVYFTYGAHHCVNIVTGMADQGEGVLIRALEPVEGIELMKRNRGTGELKNLCSGPGKLTQALGIDRAHNGINLATGPIKLEPGITPAAIVQTTRVGLTKAADKPRRFYIKDSPFISKK